MRIDQIVKYDMEKVQKALDNAKYYYNADEHNHSWANTLINIAETYLNDPKEIVADVDMLGIIIGKHTAKHNIPFCDSRELANTIADNLEKILKVKDGLKYSKSPALEFIGLKKEISGGSGSSGEGGSGESGIAAQST